jgi:hypothetical protein
MSPPQRRPQQGNTASKKSASTRDRLPAQVFTRGTTGAVTVKMHSSSQSTSLTNVGSSIDERSRSQTRDPPRDRSPRPPRTRRRSELDERPQPRLSRSSDHEHRQHSSHHVPQHVDSSSDQGSAASPASRSRGRHTPSSHSKNDGRDSPSTQKPPPSIQKPSLQKPGSRDSSPAPSLDSQKMHIKATKKVIDGTFHRSRRHINPLVSVGIRVNPLISFGAES